MKKMFLSLLIASLPLAVFGAAPIEVRLQKGGPTAVWFDLIITSLYDGRLIVDYPNIVVNKGKAGCVIYDHDEIWDRQTKNDTAKYGNAFAGLFGGAMDTLISSDEQQKNDFRKLGVGAEENSKLAFEYGDARKSLMICQKDRILEIVVPTNVGTYTFSFR
ncbi:hypothetical protein [Campylobacter concisus]|jgi:hypothetical protein|uniref:hypothetical protein n=1 Tax=Campylobacter concisus TaxID=199 RepID=UPI00122D1883|nr:hypothetical protein [Campylobacter concisus]